MDKILIIDDSRFAVEVLKSILQDGYGIISAGNGKEGIRMACACMPSLILLDVEMPDMNGFEVLKTLKQMENTRDIPVIFLTGVADPEYEEKGFILGAVDYIAKPYHENVVRARVKTQIDLFRYHKKMEEELLKDALTEINNRRSMEMRLSLEWDDAMRKGKPLTVAIIDIDYFKKLNDTYGHLEGDRALRLVARTIDNFLPRPDGYVARYGGEEFAVILPDTDAKKARKMMEALRIHILDRKIPNKNSPVNEYLTISAGCAAIIPSAGDSMEEFIRQADVLLYLCKKNGRNQVAIKELQGMFIKK